MKNKVVMILGMILTLIIIVLALLPKEEKSINDYKIVDESDICAQALEKIYTDSTTTYYLPCLKGDQLYLEWQDGTKTKLLDSLQKGDVTFQSLLDHGLEVVTNE